MMLSRAAAGALHAGGEGLHSWTKKMARVSTAGRGAVRELPPGMSPKTSCPASSVVHAASVSCQSQKAFVASRLR
jgi:hypothetical protein